jgi:hypothetical protein
VVRLGDGHLAVLENRLHGLAVNLVRVGRGDVVFRELRRLVENHVHHVGVMIRERPLAQELVPDAEHLVQQELEIPYIDPLTCHNPFLLQKTVKWAPPLRRPDYSQNN